MSAEVFNFSDFQKPENLDAPAIDRDKEKFATDMVADEWANDLVHGLMVQFFERGDVDTTDPVYAKLMEGLSDITRSMTRHHLGVFDETALMLEKFDGEVSVGVLEYYEGDDSDG